jgi:apolipoprotein D and lipocalin family protein
MFQVISILVLSVFMVQAKDAPAVTPVKTVESVDITRYQGKWYQIAAIPQFFERNCYSDTMAEYSPDANRIKVYNTCTDKDGKTIKATGQAKVVDTTTNAKLKVTFVKLINWLYLIGGDYWILDLDTNYRWVIVGEKTHKYGWILARDPYLSNAELVMLSDKLKAQGYDPCTLITARQKGGFDSRQPLCKVITR